MWFATRVVSFCALHACGARPAPVATAADDGAPLRPSSCTATEARGVVERAELRELSGLTSSVRHPGVLWAINDSGEHTLRTFALDEQGRVLGSAALLQVRPRDVEAITLWHQPSRPHDLLLLADIGDNAARDGQKGRDDIVVYALDEPDPHRQGPGQLRFTLHLTYPDRPHDAEALLIDPQTEVLYLFTKETLGPAQVYRLAPPFGEGSRVLEHAFELPVGSAGFPGLMITAAAIRRDGRLLAFRTYGSLLAFPRAPGADLEATLRGAPVLLPLPPERQGESVTFAHDGRGVFTVSEGDSPTLHFTSVACADTLLGP